MSPGKKVSALEKTLRISDALGGDEPHESEARREKSRRLFDLQTCFEEL
jgi:hypothetical protein